MPTTTVKSIGTSSRDYSTIQAWENACPSDLTNSDEIWKGECYNDSEFLGSSAEILWVTGMTADATRYLWLTCATGQSFTAHASKLTNPLTYDQSKGVGLRCTSFIAFVVLAQRAFRMTGLQLYLDSTAGGVHTLDVDISTTNACIIENCLIQGRQTTISCNPIGSGGSTWVNNVIIDRSDTGSTGTWYDNSAGTVVNRAINNTIVRPSDLTSGGTGVRANGSDTISRNNAVFGFSTAFTGTFDTTNSKNNATDAASAPGSSNQTSKTFSSQFQDVTDSGGYDFRAKAGGDLQNGIRDQSYTNDLDIVGQARSTSTPTIGAWEIAAADGGAQLRRLGGVRHTTAYRGPVNVFREAAEPARRRIFLPSLAFTRRVNAFQGA